MNVLSGGMGMANHEGEGAGLSVRAFDLPRILPPFFRLKKEVAEGKPKAIKSDKIVLKLGDLQAK